MGGAASLEGSPPLATEGGRRRVLRDWSRKQRQRPADLVLGHDIGLVQWFSALRAEGAERRAQFEGVIAQWARLLEDDTYWQAWLEVHPGQLGPDSVEMSQAARAMVAERLEQQLASDPDLEDAYHLEREGARLLAEHGGLPLANGSRLICGPLLLRSLELESVLTTQLGTGDHDTLVLRQCFSSLGPVGLCLAGKHPERALAHLRRLHCDACAGQASPPPKGGNAPLTCRQGCPQFAKRNPGYAGLKDGAKVLRQDAVALQIECHCAVGAQRAEAGDISGATTHWREGLALAQSEGDSDQARRPIVRHVVSIAETLRRADRTSEAIAIVEAVRALVWSDELEGRLAQIVTDRGVDRANEGQFSAAADDLRRAVSLAPRLGRARKSLMHVLCTLARDKGPMATSTREGCLLEAIALAEQDLREDSDDENALGIRLHALGQLGRLRYEQGAQDEHSPERALREILALLEEAGEQDDPESTPNGDGLTVASGAGIEELEEAVAAMPQNAALRRRLADKLEEKADSLVAEGRLHDARALVARGLALMPAHTGLHATLTAIRMAEPPPSTPVLIRPRSTPPPAVVWVAVIALLWWVWELMKRLLRPRQRPRVSTSSRACSREA